MITGTPARRAANRPRTPALPLCVWAISVRCARNISASRRNAQTSFQGCTGRTKAGRIVNRSGMVATSDSIEPSGPVVGPEINLTSMSGFWRRPSTELTVFSCAPPTMSRVMTCVTRIAESAARGALELGESFGDLLRLGRVRRGVLQIGFAMFDGGGHVLFSEGDFTQTVMDLVQGWADLLQRFIVTLRGVELIALQLRDGAVQQRNLVLRLAFQDLVERRKSVLVRFGLDANGAPVE